MNVEKTAELDPRVWVLWGAAAGFPLLAGRNPFPLIALTIVVLSVRLTWQSAAGLSSWGWIVRIALIFGTIGMIFNVLTYHGGNIVLIHVSERILLIGGPLTANALIYGLLSGWAVLLLVLIGTTIAALIDWQMFLRLMPSWLTTFAVAGSVTFSFLPQTANAYRQIREAQAIRGHRLGGVRDLPPIIAPLLAVGLERAITLAEVLESRAFGAAYPVGVGRWRRFGIVGLVGTVIAAALLFFMGHFLIALIVFGGGFVAAALFSRCRAVPVRTRYRQTSWRRVDSLVAIVSLVSIFVTSLTLVSGDSGLRYEPYPNLVLPALDLPLLLALGLLIAPALIVPSLQS